MAHDHFTLDGCGTVHVCEATSREFRHPLHDSGAHGHSTSDGREAPLPPGEGFGVRERGQSQPTRGGVPPHRPLTPGPSSGGRGEKAGSSPRSV